MTTPRQEFLLRAMAVRDELKQQAESLVVRDLGREGKNEWRDKRADAVASLAGLLVEFASEVFKHQDDGK